MLNTTKIKKQEVKFRFFSGKKQIVVLLLALAATTAANAQWVRSGVTTILQYPNDYVGIGSSPSTKLHVDFNSLAGSPQLKLKESELDFARMYFQNTSGIRYWSVEGKNDAAISNERFRIGTNTNPDLLTVDGNGNMAIGNANPESKLEMAGTGIMTFKMRSIGVPGNNYGMLKFESDYQSLRYGAYITTGGSAFALIFGTYNGATLSSKFMLYGDFLRPMANGVIKLGDPYYAWHTVYSVNGLVTTSDARLKSGITDLNYGLKEIMSLRPVSYILKENPESGIKLGLIAQEVDKVIKEVVVHGVLGETAKEDDRLGIMYADLIPVLIKGMQEQQMQIKASKNTIEQLQNEIEELKKNLPQKSITQITEASLEQNSPNPFNSATTIYYTLPANFNTAQLKIMNGSGNEIKIIPLYEKGYNKLQLEAGILTAGNYYYSLAVDGKVMDTKTMVLTK
jgi:Chaperone of endosialidase